MQTNNDNESDSDLQCLWARAIEDLGPLEVFHFHFIHVESRLGIHLISHVLPLTDMPYPPPPN